MKLHKSLTADRIIAAVQADDCIGFCVECGDETHSVEPDARKYECESCGARAVYGAEELLFEVDDEDEGQCPGHPSGPFTPVGQTFYCDGSCRDGWV